MRGTRRDLAPDTVIRSRRLRREAGEPERRLWYALRQSLPQAKFRRQVPLGPYHADFCSHGARLIVEVDGDDHATRTMTDEARTRFLNDEGYRVIRFTNAEVMQTIDAVLASIAHALAFKETTGGLLTLPRPSAVGRVRGPRSQKKAPRHDPQRPCSCGHGGSPNG